MSRPECPKGIVLTREIIRSISDRQNLYDKDPEDYERKERERKREQEESQE